jgi:class 3 adenylate cyclase
MRRVIERHDGRVVNVPGDALLAEFGSVVEAVAAAVEIQQSLEGRNMELPPERRMHDATRAFEPQPYSAHPGQRARSCS